MITKLSDFEKVHEAAKKNTAAKTSKPKRGKMHKALGIPDDKEIKDVYKSGKKLAADLIAKVGKKKAASMLTFVANINKDVDVYDKAIKALESIKEGYEMDLANDAGTEHAKYVLSLAFDNEKEHNVYDIQKFYNDVANDIADDNIADMLKSSILDVLEELTMEAEKLQYVKRIEQ